MNLVLGIAASFVGALLIAAGLIVQAVEVRAIEVHETVELTLIGRLLRRPRWVAGTVLGYLAFPFQLLALAHAPLVVVQPVHAAGLLVVLAAGARILRERVRKPELAGVSAIIVGVGLAAWGAPPGLEVVTSQAGFAAATASMVLLGFIPYVLGRRCGRLTVILCAGVGFAAANVAVKGFSDQLGDQAYAAAAAYLAAAALGSLAGVLSQMTAFQHNKAVDVVPITYAIPIFLPIVVAVAVLHEHWGRAALQGSVFAIGGAFVLAGTAIVARAAPVVRIVKDASEAKPG